MMKVLINNEELSTIKVIQINDYYVIVDTEAIIDVDNFITDNYKVWKWKDDSSLLGRNKIIASTNRIDKSIPLIVFKEQNASDFLDVASDSHEVQYNNGFLDGYNQAKSSDKKYTEDDVRNAFKAGESLEYWKCMNTKTNPINFPKTGFEDDYIQSLNQSKLPDVINLEMDYILSKKDIDQAKEGDFVMNNHGSKGIINSLSKDVRVGIGNFIEISQTGDNGHDTLNINGYKIYDSKLKTTSTPEGEVINI